MNTDTEPVPNLPLLRKVLDHIDAHPAEWNQIDYAIDRGCGTTLCVAGHAAVMTGHVLAWRVDFEGKLIADHTTDDEPIHEVATRELGLTDDEAWDLFIQTAVGTPVEQRPLVQAIAEEIAARAGEVL